MIEAADKSCADGGRRETPASRAAPLTVLHVIENIDERYGGPAQSVPYLCAHLRKLGVDASIHAVDRYRRDRNAIIEEYSVPWHRYLNRLRASRGDTGPASKVSPADASTTPGEHQAGGLVDALRYAPDLRGGLTRAITGETIIHTQNLWNYPPYCAFKVARRSSVPLVCSIRGTLYPWSLAQRRYEKKLLWRLFQRRMLQAAACLHVTEPGELRAVRDRGVTTPAALIPNGVELDEFLVPRDKTECRRRLKLDAGLRYLLFLSRIHPKKGLDLLVPVWLDLARSHADWRLLIAGPVFDEPYWRDLRARIERSGVGDTVRSIGMLERGDRLDAYFAADAFCLPSRTENFGIVIAEAMAARLPVVTTTGTPWQILSQEDCGWWVDLPADRNDRPGGYRSDSANSLHDALDQVMNLSDEARAAKGVRAFEIIRRQFSWNAQAEKMKRVYEWILAGRDRPSFVAIAGEPMPPA